MPGCLRHSLPHMLKEVEEAWRFGVRTFIVFPKVFTRLPIHLYLFVLVCLIFIGPSLLKTL